MAEHKRRLPENADGPYFLDDSCIDCDACRSTSTLHFRRSNENCDSYVYRQPATQEEWELVEEANEYCPACAIEMVRDRELLALGQRHANRQCACGYT